MRTRCPAACGATSSLDVLVGHEDARTALAAAFKAGGPVGMALLRYLALHRPAQRDLTMARVATLLAELLPLLDAGCITRKGRQWALHSGDWVQAIEQMQVQYTAGKLSAPLNGHGYLLEVLAGLADRREAAAEQQHEHNKRSTAAQQRDTVQVRGQALEIGAALDVVYGGQDLALARIKAASRNAAPMPESVRQQLAALKVGKNGATPPAPP